MSTRLYWLHEDALREEHPVLQEASSEDTLCFVLDDEHLEDMGSAFSAWCSSMRLSLNSG